jgi:hypothetical protein
MVEEYISEHVTTPNSKNNAWCRWGEEIHGQVIHAFQLSHKKKGKLSFFFYPILKFISSMSSSHKKHYNFF